MTTATRRTEQAFDFRNPNYGPVFEERKRRLSILRANPSLLASTKNFYRNDPNGIVQFICDWGITVDPRNLERGIPTAVPFLLFPRQAQWINWILAHWRTSTPGITEKTRQMGFSWLSMALSCSLCLFNDGMVIGVGSRKQEYVDVIGDPKSLIEKARLFMRSLPVEFRGGWTPKHGPHMRMMFPETGSIVVGESGDELGRGNSTSIYFVDESAYLEHPLVVDAALSQTTNCRQDISTPNGMANSFAQRRWSGKTDVFTFHWRDDPRKTQAWYEKQKRELDPVVVASELDINYAASAEGVVIPAEWVHAAIGAREKLRLGEPSGYRYVGLDIADEGKDLNAMAGRKGVHLQHVRAWSGKGSDIYGTVVMAFHLCDQWGYDSFDYDADGVGAGVRGDARVINEKRIATGQEEIIDEPFRGSGAVWQPDAQMVPKRLNKDYFANLKAQSWWALRLRFQATHRALTEGTPFSEDDLITIDPTIPALHTLVMELSQPLWSLNNSGKILIDKTPPGVRSPNHADAVMICYHPATRKRELWERLGAKT